MLECPFNLMSKPNNVRQLVLLVGNNMFPLSKYSFHIFLYFNYSIRISVYLFSQISFEFTTSQAKYKTSFNFFEKITLFEQTPMFISTFIQILMYAILHSFGISILLVLHYFIYVSHFFLTKPTLKCKYYFIKLFIPE